MFISFCIWQIRKGYTWGIANKLSLFSKLMSMTGKHWYIRRTWIIWTDENQRLSPSGIYVSHFPLPWNHKEEESKISLTQLNRDNVTDWLTLWRKHRLDTFEKLVEINDMENWPMSWGVTHCQWMSSTSRATKIKSKVKDSQLRKWVTNDTFQWLDFSPKKKKTPINATSRKYDVNASHGAYLSAALLIANT